MENLASAVAVPAHHRALLNQSVLWKKLSASKSPGALNYRGILGHRIQLAATFIPPHHVAYQQSLELAAALIAGAPVNPPVPKSASHGFVGHAPAIAALLPNGNQRRPLPGDPFRACILMIVGGQKRHSKRHLTEMHTFLAGVDAIPKEMLPLLNSLSQTLIAPSRDAFYDAIRDLVTIGDILDSSTTSLKATVQVILGVRNQLLPALHQDVVAPRIRRSRGDVQNEFRL